MAGDTHTSEVQGLRQLVDSNPGMRQMWKEGHWRLGGGTRERNCRSETWRCPFVALEMRHLLPAIDTFLLKRRPEAWEVDHGPPAHCCKALSRSRHPCPPETEMRRPQTGCPPCHQLPFVLVLDRPFSAQVNIPFQ